MDPPLREHDMMSLRQQPTRHSRESGNPVTEVILIGIDFPQKLGLTNSLSTLYPSNRMSVHF
jgi:hypothetical protein